jgi:MoaA/NifB/PqqE/SkfB family radical SAM enzyme
MMNLINNITDKNINRNLIKWEITKKCNFNCHYCGVVQAKDDLSKPIDISKLKESLIYLKSDWKFDIQGGEPFLEKNIIDIASEITKNHYLTILTNFTTQNVYDFADIINPDKCLCIDSAVHVIEREKTDLKLKSYIKKVLYFQNKGFNIISNYVAHPALFNRIKSDISYLRSEGIKNVKIKIFIGEYDRKYYPYSYNSHEKEFLESMDSVYPELELIKRPHKYHGQLCFAGKKQFLMDRKGNLTRCFSTLKNYGNLFEKLIKIDINPKPCPQNKYFCPYECMLYSIPNKGNNFSIMKEDYIEKMLRTKPHEYTNNKFWIISGAMFDKVGIILIL